MTARLSSFLIWAVVAATVVAWGLRLGAQGRAVPAHAVTVMPTPATTADLTRLFGAPPEKPVEAPTAAPPADSRFKLIGVVAPRPGVHAGLALLSVDGKPARAYGVGAEIEPGLRVQLVDHRRVEITAPGSERPMSLAMPALPDAARGRPGEGGGPVAMPGMPPQVQGMPIGVGLRGQGGPMPVMQPPPQAPIGAAMEANGEGNPGNVEPPQAIGAVPTASR